ncbi:ral GTPase-activating protein subunit beta-like isoform 2-T4 [Pholidichthys leucotaenia]
MDQSTPTRHAQVSVLSCFPPSVGRDVAIAVVKALGASLANPDNRSLLCTDREVTWTMEVLSYGLTLPLDGDTVRLCVGIYLDWLMALVSKRDSIPPPISREPNVYAQKIVKHLYSLFLPRSDQMNPVYPSLCQQVLCAVQSLARESPLMTKETWETLLHFLLRINHTILAPPTPAGGISDLSMAVLLEVWLLSCSHWFPSHSLWQTCRQMLSSWRHQPVVVQQWTRIVSALTSRLLQLTFGPTFPHFKVPDEDAALIPTDMDDVRIPHTCSPVDLCGSTFHASTPLSQEGMFIEDEGELPAIFFRAMRGVSTLVDAFLGVSIMNKEPTEQLLPNTGMHI